MANGQLRAVLRHLRTAAAARDQRDLGDGELLGRFVARGEEAAFTLLVQRHGPMVFGLCRRILGNAHDAEDAFQATFLILARKARSIRSHASLGSWLHGVARRVAVRAKSQAACRRGHERRAVEMACTEATDERTWDELRQVLDEEIGALPESCRAAVVLFHLEGKTQSQAAQELGLPRSTVAGRLERARELLRQRLSRRGVVLSAGALVAALAEQAAPAAVPALLTIATVRAAALGLAGRAAGAVAAPVISLTEGVIQAMNVGKWKLCCAALLVVGALGFGTAGPGLRPLAADAQTTAPAAAPWPQPQPQPYTKKQKPAPQPQPSPPADRAERARVADLLRQLADRLEVEKQVEEARRVLADLEKLLAERARKDEAQRQRQALDVIAKGLAELKKATTGDAQRRAVTDFESAFGKLRGQLEQGTPRSVSPPPSRSDADPYHIDPTLSRPPGGSRSGILTPFTFPQDSSLSRSIATPGAADPNAPADPRYSYQAIAATRYPGATSPPGGMPSTPTPAVIGVVHEVTPEGIVRFSVCSGGVVRPGQTLEVIRVGPNQRLGQLKAVAVGAQGAAGTSVSAPPGTTIRPGDWVVPTDALPGPGKGSTPPQSR